MDIQSPTASNQRQSPDAYPVVSSQQVANKTYPAVSFYETNGLLREQKLVAEEYRSFLIQDLFFGISDQQTVVITGTGLVIAHTKIIPEGSCQVYSTSLEVSLIFSKPPSGESHVEITIAENLGPPSHLYFYVGWNTLSPTAINLLHRSSETSTC